MLFIAETRCYQYFYFHQKFLNQNFYTKMLMFILISILVLNKWSEVAIGNLKDIIKCYIKNYLNT